MYLVYAIVMFHVNGFSGDHYVMMAALFLAYMGDLFLIFDLNILLLLIHVGPVCLQSHYMTVPVTLMQRCILRSFWQIGFWGSF